ncbi:MAG: nitrous oxide reductase accessory protein NosL [Alphaproteobacteria bacterium]|nr:nitrous oxide reductase accessory protein NosL [Alphaproteobacteria bacterium]
MKTNLLIVLGASLALAAGCTQDTSQAEKPEAIALTEEAAGHYCQMVILEHDGPKAQAHLAGLPEPLWFSQVRDGIAYLKSPEQSAELLVLYVNDMGEAKSWSDPGQDNWIDAQTAYFVVGSDAIGGMGAPELAPFSDQEKAEAFAGRRGGKVLRLEDIPAETVLSPVELMPSPQGGNS